MRKRITIRRFYREALILPILVPIAGGTLFTAPRLFVQDGGAVDRWLDTVATFWSLQFYIGFLPYILFAIGLSIYFAFVKDTEIRGIVAFAPVLFAPVVAIYVFIWLGWDLRKEPAVDWILELLPWSLLYAVVGAVLGYGYVLVVEFFFRRLRRNHRIITTAEEPRERTS